MDTQALFINREESWIDFNARVLACAKNPEIPLNDRFNFLSITSSNLDEFISVRYPATFEDHDEKKKVRTMIKRFMDSQQIVYKSLKTELLEHGVEITLFKKLSKDEQSEMKAKFIEEVFPNLTPVDMEINQKPDLLNGQTCIAVLVDSGTSKVVLIAVDNRIPKIFKIKNKVILLEDLILNNLEVLFMKQSIRAKGFFRLIRNQDITLTHNQDSFIIDRMEETLERRRHGNPIWLEASGLGKYLTDVVTQLYSISEKEIYNGELCDLKRFSQHLLSEEFSYQPMESFDLMHRINEESIFSAIDKKDILLQHPYDSFQTVIQFLNHAALDDAVRSIKMTLYRVSGEDSPVIDALINAAERGKSVSVLVEIKARFDENLNLRVIKKLRAHGVTVLLGMEYQKTHCKFIVVVRDNGERNVIYSHIGTGNYNEKTAKIYTDLSYFTNRQKVGMDLLHIFNILSGISNPDNKLQKVFYAPVNLRTKLYKLIDREIENASKGKKAAIFMKINSLSDPEMVDKLYEAADKGVVVNIICRGVCSIVPRDRLFVKSIVGRFLEHSRIYYFYNNGDHEYFISSADLLTRNLDRRIEILVSMKGSHVVNNLAAIIRVMLEDQKNSFTMLPTGTYEKMKGEFDSHKWFSEHHLTGKKVKFKKDFPKPI